MRNAIRINKAKNWRGHLWQDRYFSCVVDPENIANVIAYIELNPVRAFMIKFNESYRWRSELAVHNERKDPLISYSSSYFEKIPSGKEWLEYLINIHHEQLDKIRVAISQNLAYGSSEFIRYQEGKTKRKLTAGKAGRHRQSTENR